MLLISEKKEPEQALHCFRKPYGKGSSTACKDSFQDHRVCDTDLRVPLQDAKEAEGSIKAQTGLVVQGAANKLVSVALGPIASLEPSGGFGRCLRFRGNSVYVVSYCIQSKLSR